MYCWKCGAQIPEDGLFCPRCGIQLRPAAPPDSGPQGDKKKRSWRTAFFVLAGCMLCALLIQFCAVFPYLDMYVATPYGRAGKVAAFVPAVLSFALILAGCVAAMHFKKTALCIVLSGLNTFVAFFAGIGLMEISKGMIAEGISKALTVLASCQMIYFWLALAMLVLVILNRKTL